MNDKDKKSSAIKIPYKFIIYFILYAGLAGIIFYVGMFVFTTYWGFPEIGKFGEKRSYVTQYWVNLQSDAAGARNGRVKSDIEHYGANYFLLRVCWPGDICSDFVDCQISKTDNKGTYIPSKIECRTDNENIDYTISLGEKVR